MRPRWKQPDDELPRLTREEARLTVYWYERMSGQVRWKEGEREKVHTRFESLSEEIRWHQKGDAAKWFADLPPE